MVLITDLKPTIMETATSSLISSSDKTAENLRYLTDQEFEDLRKRLEFAYYEAAKIHPVFDENTTLTGEQYDILAPFLFCEVTPFWRAQKKFRDEMDKAWANCNAAFGNSA